MSRKNGKRAKDTSANGRVTPAAKGAPAASQEEEREKADFGGLPNRDLKKNLGCG